MMVSPTKQYCPFIALVCINAILCSAVFVNPSTGQRDYSLQWAQYYRSIGNIAGAEQFEREFERIHGHPSAYGYQPAMMPIVPASFMQAPLSPPEMMTTMVASATAADLPLESMPHADNNCLNSLNDAKYSNSLSDEA